MVYPMPSILPPGSSLTEGLVGCGRSFMLPEPLGPGAPGALSLGSVILRPCRLFPTLMLMSFEPSGLYCMMTGCVIRNFVPSVLSPLMYSPADVVNISKSCDATAPSVQHMAPCDECM